MRARTATINIPYKNLARKIDEMGGLWEFCEHNTSRYGGLFNTLQYYHNPTKKTIDWILAKTGMTYEEAFETE